MPPSCIYLDVNCNYLCHGTCSSKLAVNITVTANVNVTANVTATVGESGNSMQQCRAMSATTAIVATENGL